MSGYVDYCTGFFEGWWAFCCERHDGDYVAQIGKLLADERLWQCVTTAAGDSPLAMAVSGVVASVMFAGVGLFGRRFYKRAGKQVTE